MSQILLVAADWQARALLRAQLIEDGLDVEAHDTVAAAIKSLWASRSLPSLLIADLSQSENPAEDIAQISQWSKLLPVWILAAQSVTAPEELAHRGFEKVLFRPVDVGQLVRQIKNRLAARGQESERHSE